MPRHKVFQDALLKYKDSFNNKETLASSCEMKGRKEPHTISHNTEGKHPQIEDTFKRSIPTTYTRKICLKNNAGSLFVSIFTHVLEETLEKPFQ